MEKDDIEKIINNSKENKEPTIFDGLDALLSLGRLISSPSNYEQRKIDNFENETLLVSTAKIFDSEFPIETAVADHRYNNGNIIIVENYLTEEEAKIGHKKWVDLMLNNPPEVIGDVSQAKIASFSKKINPEFHFIFKRRDLLEERTCECGWRSFKFSKYSEEEGNFVIKPFYVKCINCGKEIYIDGKKIKEIKPNKNF